MTGGVDPTGGPTITSVEGYVVKAPQPYRYSGEGGDTASDEGPDEADEDVTFVPGTDYFFEPDWDQVYSLQIEAVLLNVTTEDGDLLVPEGPGLGVEVDEAALEEVVSESFRVSLD